MPTFATATFDGATGTLVEAADPNWTAQSGSATIESNRAKVGSSTAVYYHSAVPGSADYEVSAEMWNTVDLAMSGGVTARHSTSALTFYHGRYVLGQGWQLFKSVAGSLTQLGGTVSTPTIALNNFRTGKLRVKGNEISLYVDGALVIGPITDTAISAAGRVGFRITGGAGGGQLNNWQASTLTVSNAYVNVGGNDKLATSYVNVSGVWKTAAPFVNVNGTWKSV